MAGVAVKTQWGVVTVVVRSMDNVMRASRPADDVYMVVWDIEGQEGKCSMQGHATVAVMVNAQDFILTRAVGVYAYMATGIIQPEPSISNPETWVYTAEDAE